MNKFIRKLASAAFCAGGEKSVSTKTVFIANV